MIAEIAVNQRDWADILFLVAAILSAVAAVLAWTDRTLTQTMGWAAVCAVSIGWLLL